MNYEKMSDLEINTEVAKKIGGCRGRVGDWMPNGVKAIDAYSGFYTERDFCNRPQDAWAIITKNNIELSPEFRGEWVASHVSQYTYTEEPVYGVQCIDDNPLRAAMICFLMMEKSKDEN